MTALLAAIRPRSHVEMHVVEMVAVSVGAKPHVEAAAPLLVHCAKEVSNVRVASAPPVKNSKPAAVRQDKCTYVDRIGATVLAEFLPCLPVQWPAAIGCQAFDLHDPASQPLACGRLDGFARPSRELPRCGASHCAEVADPRSDLEQLHGAKRTAAAAKHPIGQRPEAHAFAAKIRMALTRGLVRMERFRY